ncbi:MAG: hypothetical protein R3C31_05740 [Hyphomonadaceae bacterium]
MSRHGFLRRLNPLHSSPEDSPSPLAGVRREESDGCDFDGASAYAILLSANATADDNVLIRAHVLSEGEPSMPESASAFLVKLDSWAAMQTQSEQGAQSMRLTFFPRRL